MAEQEYFELANTEPMITVKGPKTGNDYNMRRYTYGALVPDENHPLSCVSVSNSSISIDLWKGCAWRCAYCHVQGTFQDIADGSRMPVKPLKRSRFTVDEIVDALVVHPFFIANTSIISIGTASTEPFASGAVAESTLEIMQAIAKRGLRNPFWIVTKAAFPEKIAEGVKKVIDGGNPLLLSLCWAGNPKEIEPSGNDRFRNIELAKACGAHVAWYMRPIVAEWGGSEDNLARMIENIATKYGQYIDMIVPGGLRWTEGIEYGLLEVHSQPMPEISKDDNVKCLSDDLWKFIVEKCEEHFPGKPVYKKSSCQLSAMLGIGNINSVQVVSPDDCRASECPDAQRLICAQGSIKSLAISELQQACTAMGIVIEIKGVSSCGYIESDPPLKSFTYAVQQTLLKLSATLAERKRYEAAA